MQAECAVCYDAAAEVRPEDNAISYGIILRRPHNLPIVSTSATKRLPQPPTRFSLGRRRSFAGAVSLVVIALPLASAAADPGLTLTPSVGLQETYTDNGSGGAASKPETVTQFSPGVSVHGETVDTKIDFTYTPSFNYYNTHSEPNQLDQNFNGVATVTPFGDYLTVDMTGVATQTGNGNTSNQPGLLLAPGNRELVYFGTMAPHFQAHFSDVATLDAFYRLNSSNISDENPRVPGQPSLSSNSLERSAELALGSANSLGRVGLRLDFNHSDTSGSGMNTSSTSDDDSFGVSYQIARAYQVNGSIGYQKLSYPASGAQTGFNTEGMTWNLGFSFTPNQLSTASIGYGFRQGSYNPSIQIGYQLGPRTQLTASYLVTVQNQLLANQQNLRFLQYDQFGNAIDSRTGLPFNPANQTFGQQNVLFRDKPALIAVTHQLVRSSVTLTATYEERHSLSAQKDNDSAWGFTGSYSRNFTPLMSGSLSVSYTNHTTTGLGISKQVSNNIDFGATFSYTISPTATFDITETYFNVISNTPAIENKQQQLTVGLRKSL